MKRIFLVFAFVVCSLAFAQKSNPNFDAALADSLKADTYGMKSYTFVLLQKGENTSKDANFIKKCFESHLENIFALVEKGEMIVSGPFGENGNGFRGFFIFKSTSFDVVEAMLQNDLAIREGLLKPILIPWYGSAALPIYLEKHQKIWQKMP